MMPSARVIGPPNLVASWRELYTHRALITTLVGRQLSARYRGSLLGFLWTFLNPVLLLLVYTLVFSVYLRIGMKGYPAFVFAGLLPWLWFSSSVLEGVYSIVGGGSLVTRVLFPPQILPTVTVLASLANLLFSLPILLVFLAAFDAHFSPAWVMLPVVLCVQLLLTLGIAFLVASLNVHYRDVQHLVANVMMLWFFLTPVIYPAEQIPERLRRFLWLNPMASLVTAYQDICFHGRFPPAGPLAVSALVAVAALVVGTAVLNRLRDSFAEDL